MINVFLHCPAELFATGSSEGVYEGVRIKGGASPVIELLQLRTIIKILREDMMKLVFSEGDVDLSSRATTTRRPTKNYFPSSMQKGKHK